MKELSVEIILPAPVDQVWKVLTNFDDYSSWNPYVSMEGQPVSNGRVKLASVAGAGKLSTTTYAAISKLVPMSELELRNGIPFLTESVRFFKLSPVEDRTLLRHGVRFTGALAGKRHSTEGKVRQLRNYYDAFGKALTDRLLGRRLRNPSGNRHARRRREAQSDR